MDCMFLLLATFMYATTSMVIQRGVRVDLAKAKTGETAKEEKKETVYLSVDKSGSFFWDKVPVTPDQLQRHLREFRNQANRYNPIVLLVNIYNKEVGTDLISRTINEEGVVTYGRCTFTVAIAQF